MRCATRSAGRRRTTRRTTAVSCCGANPGMVSWFVKQALINLAEDLGHAFAEPGVDDREGWARLMRDLGREGHPHRRARHAALEKPEADERLRQHLVGGRFSLRGHAAGGARLGHAREMAAGERPAGDDRLEGRRLPAAARRQHARALVVPDARARNSAFLSRTTSRSRSRTISRCGRATSVVYRPTCHYAYHPSNDAVLSLHELFGRAGKMQDEKHILDENEIVDGIDELGVLLYGHAKNAYWYGSQLSIEETRELAPQPERDRAAGDLGGACRHGLGARESRKPGSSKPTRWIFAAASRCSVPISGRLKATTPTGRRSRTARDFSRRTSTQAIHGSSGMCWCDSSYSARWLPQPRPRAGWRLVRGGGDRLIEVVHLRELAVSSAARVGAWCTSKVAMPQRRISGIWSASTSPVARSSPLKLSRSRRAAQSNRSGRRRISGRRGDERQARR